MHMYATQNRTASKRFSFCFQISRQRNREGNEREKGGGGGVGGTHRERTARKSERGGRGEVVSKLQSALLANDLPSMTSVCLKLLFFLFRGLRGRHFPPTLYLSSLNGYQLVNTLLPLLAQGQCMMARRPETTVKERSLMSSHTVPGQHVQPAPTSLGQGCMRV